MTRLIVAISDLTSTQKTHEILEFTSCAHKVNILCVLIVNPAEKQKNSLIYKYVMLQSNKLYKQTYLKSTKC